MTIDHRPHCAIVTTHHLTCTCAEEAPHICDYVDGRCPRPGPHGGVPDPDPSTARVEDFTVRASNDGEMSLQCAHYARGCWWEVVFGSGWPRADDPGDSLGELLEVARKHLAEAHRVVVEGSVTPAR